MPATSSSANRKQVTVVLRRRAPLPPETLLSAADLQAGYAADPTDIDTVTSVVRESGFEVVDVHPASRRVRVEGDGPEVAGLPRLLEQHGLLGSAVVAVLGLDDRPQAQTRHRVARADSIATSYTPLQLATIYQFPASDGAGQTIAIVELGGGFARSDLDTYFSGLGISTPTVSAVGVDGGVNSPGNDPNGADGEVLLDIEVAGAIAPAADLVVYFAPNSDAGFHDAIADATHATPTPAAISISWGQSEDQWSQQARVAMDSACADAAALGIVVLSAAGDNGSSDNQTPGSHTDFPASSPHVVGCGGTSLRSGTSGVQESVWNDGGQGGATGGGVSDVFPLPSWQQTAGVPDKAGTSAPGRGVPDIAANADPQTGYQVVVDGQQLVIGGTSAVAPLWAGLVARLAALGGGRVGPALPKLYASATPGTSPAGLRDITTGSNGTYSAAPGWDPCTGLGVPATGIAQLLSRSATSTAK